MLRINVAPEQVDDAIDAALIDVQRTGAFGAEHMYFARQIDATALAVGYYPLPANIVSVSKAFNLDGNGSVGASPFGSGFSLQGFGWLGDASSWASTGAQGGVLGYGVQVRTYLSEMEFQSEYRNRPVRFNLNTGRVFLDANPGQLKVGSYILLEGYALINPDEYPKLWMDTLFRRLATAYIKRAWANNLRKFEGTQMIGGVSFNGQKMYDEVVEELKELDLEITNGRFGGMPSMRIG